MNRVLQVGHVAAKDIWRMRWVLILYVALIVAVMASVVNGRAFGRYVPSPSDHGSQLPDTFGRNLPYLIVLVGLILSASLLQLDSPTRANAFWASRPLSPSAVLLAKVGVSMAIVGSSLLALFTALGFLHATAETTVTMLARSAIAFVDWALAVLVVSAITDDFRGAVVALIAILLGILFLPSALREVGGSATLIGIAGGVSVLVYLYRTRDSRPRARIAAAVVAACLLRAPSWFSSGMTQTIPKATRAAASAGLSLVIEPLNPSLWHSSNQLKMKLGLVSTSPAPGERLEFRADTVTIRPVGRDEFTIPDRFTGPVASHWGRLQLGPTVRWIHENSLSDWKGPSEFAVHSETVDGTPIIGPVASVAIVGTITSLRSRVIASLPLRVGAAATHGGRRVAIYGFSHDANGVDVWIQVAALAELNFDHPLIVSNSTSSGDALEFAIFNEARSEAIFLDTKSRTRQSISGLLVLPWAPFGTSSGLFTTRPFPLASENPLDDAWYAGARLVVFDWEVVERYRVRGDAAIH